MISGRDKSRNGLIATFCRDEYTSYKTPFFMDSEQNVGTSSEILPSFRTEAVEDRDVIFNQIQES